MRVDSVPWPTECVELNTKLSQPHITRLVILHMKNKMVGKVIHELKQLGFYWSNEYCAIGLEHKASL